MRVYGPASFLAAVLVWCIGANAGVVRVMTFNVHSIGEPAEPEHEALRSIVERICPDIAMFQEVRAGSDVENLEVLADETGFPYFEVSAKSGTLSGNLLTACISAYPIQSSVSWSAAAVSGDPEANDITRDLFECRIALPGGHYLGVFPAHLKAYTDYTSKFRRQVELIRTNQVIQSYRSAYPNDHVVYAGDLNSDIDDGPFGSPTYTSLPSGLPASYRLGSDITFPVIYDPFETILAMDLALTDPTWEDSTDAYSTYPSYDSRIDYVWYSMGLTDIGDEVYYSGRDDGEDDAPPGNWMYKCGEPLSADISPAASDHLAVFVDFDYGEAYSPTPYLSPTPSPTATAAPPTATPTASATPTNHPPSPTSTPTAAMATGAYLWMPSHMFQAGDSCACVVTVWNGGTRPFVGYPLIVVLDLFGSYYFAPSFSDFDSYLDDYPIFQPGATVVSVVDAFNWPTGAGMAYGARWYAALTDPDVMYTCGVMDSWEFGWR
ncbi:endonuclease/exonuclease/phosphatase family protein [bacterium]|nr:endonuclease/exonuclease/phosphatase family protein [candidate division CSSED10-310 bacterium]